MNCIYCKKDIKEDNKSTEHIFPKSFGCPDTWTIDCVCMDCNNEFGKTIERYLAGDSIEGLRRLQKLGSRSKKPIKQTRLKINIPDEDRYGEFRGAIRRKGMPAETLVQEGGDRETADDAGVDFEEDLFDSWA